MKRRDFIQSSLACFCAASPAIGTSVHSHKISVEPFNIAVIGCGREGSSDIRILTRNPSFKVIGISDVHKKQTARIGELNLIPIWQDYRLMFKDIGREIDGVIVAAPDHMHFPIILHAIKYDKHIFCHTPLCHTLSELISIKEKIKANICLDVGLKTIYSPVYDLVCEIIQSEKIGSIQSIHAWAGKQSWVQATPKSEAIDSVPQDLDWNLWLGAAPFRNYVDKIYTPHMWRGVRDFGSGLLGDRFFESMAVVFRSIGSLDLKEVRCISNIGPTNDKFGDDRHFEITCNIGEASSNREIKLDWMEGNVKPDTTKLPIAFRGELPRTGCILIGDDGFISFSKNKLVETSIPDVENLIKRKKADRTIPYYNDIDCYEIWRRSCIAGEPSYCSLDAMYSCLEVPLAASISAKYPLKELKWDRKRQTFNDQEADTSIKKDYRKF